MGFLKVMDLNLVLFFFVRSLRTSLIPALYILQLYTFFPGGSQNLVNFVV